MEKVKRIYKPIVVNGKTCILIDLYRGPASTFSNPNFMGTGMALCGRLAHGQSFNQWVFEKNLRMFEIEKKFKLKTNK